MSVVSTVISLLTLWAGCWIVVRVRREVRRAEARTLVGACWVNVAPLPRGCKGGSHWPRDPVQLADGTTVAHICRRCDRSWVNEQWVNAG